MILQLLNFFSNPWKSSLAMQAEKMRDELENSRKNEQLIKIKEKEIDALNNQVRDLKLKSSQYQTRLKESQENSAQLEGLVKKQSLEYVILQCMFLIRNFCYFHRRIIWSSLYIFMRTVRSLFKL